MIDTQTVKQHTDLQALIESERGVEAERKRRRRRIARPALGGIGERGAGRPTWAAA